MKGKELMNIVRQAQSNWHREAEELAARAMDELRYAAERGDTNKRFHADVKRINRSVVNIARCMLRSEGITLSYSPGHPSGNEFNTSINIRMVQDFDND